MPGYYTVKTQGPYSYRVFKLDEGFNPIYHSGRDKREVFRLVRRNSQGYWLCNCEQHERVSCRHRTIVRMFVQLNRVDSGWFYNYDEDSWERSFTDPVRAMQKAKERSL